MARFLQSIVSRQTQAVWGLMHAVILLPRGLVCPPSPPATELQRATLSLLPPRHVRLLPGFVLFCGSLSGSEAQNDIGTRKVGGISNPITIPEICTFKNMLIFYFELKHTYTFQIEGGGREKMQIL